MQDSKHKVLPEHVKLAAVVSGVVKHYAWGAHGRESIIARFVSPIEDNKPYAELWFGTHPSGPSPILHSPSSEPLYGISLRDLVANHAADALGSRVLDQFGASLPFMMKILSIKKALSIQAHPSMSQAAILHQRSPQVYPDANHKPEIAIALTPVRLLYGFKSLDALKVTLQRVPELYQLLPRHMIDEVMQSRPVDPSTLYRLCVEALLNSSPAFRAQLGASIRGRADAARERCAEENLFLSLSAQYELSDTGLFVALLMNEITLGAGSAIFVPAGILHAYLSGNLAECMANSDNVVRVGLTEKPKDREALFEVVDFSSTTPMVLEPRPHTDNPAIRRFETPAREFEVDVMCEENGKLEFSGNCSPAIVLCVDGHATFKAGDTHEKLSPGTALFIPASLSGYSLEVAKAHLFRAQVPSLGLPKSGGSSC